MSSFAPSTWIGSKNSREKATFSHSIQLVSEKNKWSKFIWIESIVFFAVNMYVYVQQHTMMYNKICLHSFMQIFHQENVKHYWIQLVRSFCLFVCLFVDKHLPQFTCTNWLHRKKHDLMLETIYRIESITTNHSRYIRFA